MTTPITDAGGSTPSDEVVLLPCPFCGGTKITLCRRAGMTLLKRLYRWLTAVDPVETEDDLWWWATK